MDRKQLIPVKLDNYKPLREVVFESLREAIINGLLKPGERMMEIQVAEEMGVSRTPVREAIRKLELEGFLVMIPRKGAYVASLSLKDVAEVFEIRVVLEGLAAALAAERMTGDELEQMERVLVRKAEAIKANDLDAVVAADTDFHDMIFRSSRNARLGQIINHQREQIQRFRVTSLAEPKRMRESLEEHKKIVEALSERDAAASQAAAQEHIENAENSMLEAIRKGGLQD